MLNLTLDLPATEDGDIYQKYNYSIDSEYGGEDGQRNYPGGEGGRGIPGFINGTSGWNSSDLFNMFETSTTACLSLDGSGANASCFGGLNDTNVSSTALADDEAHANPLPYWQIGIFGFLAGATSLITIMGNLIVVMSFVLERSIRQPTNYFIASLAVSDLLIGSISMPFYTVYLLAGKYWPMGEFLCDMWLSVDYTVCLTSIYTVFCITIDRFCSVKIPAKYRNWRTERRVLIMIASTWIVPILVFFITIIGWQYFVGERTVKKGQCYVQYMEDPLFNTILQVGYFWITLTVMCVLYTGIYKVALDLQRRSEAKRTKMTSLVSMAGQTMTKIGIGMSQQNKKEEKKKSLKPPVELTKSTGNFGTIAQATSSTSFSSSKNNEKEEERSSSPAFPSDTDPSSQSPRGASPNVQRHPHKKKTKHKHRSSDKEAEPLKLHAPPKGKNYKSQLNSIPPRKRIAKSEHAVNSISALESKPQADANHTCQEGGKACSVNGNKRIQLDTDRTNQQAKPAYENNALTPDDCDSAQPKDFVQVDLVSLENVANDKKAVVISVPPEHLEGVRYIDQESLKSLQSNDNIRLLMEGAHQADQQSAPPVQRQSGSGPGLPPMNCNPTNAQQVSHDPESPVWKKRIDFSNMENENNTLAVPSSPLGTTPSGQSASTGSFPSSPGPPPTPSPTPDPPQRTFTLEPLPQPPVTAATTAAAGKPPAAIKSSLSPANIQVKATCDTDHRSKSISKLAKSDEIQPLNADEPTGSRPSSKRDRNRGVAGSPLSSFVKVVKRSKRSKSKKEKTAQSRSENRARKALRTITIILGAFVLCWTPWHILSMIISFCEEKTVCLEPILYDISYWLCYLNSPINPLCYAMANAQFKKTFLRILRFDWHRT